MNRSQIATTGMLPNGQQFIQDTWQLQVLKTDKVLSEGVGGMPVTRVTGIFQIADEINSNFRIYPYSVLSEAVKQIQNDITQRAVVGELCHPSDAKINLDRVSHVVTKVWMDGKKVFGEAEVLDNLPLGAVLKGLFERKIRVGISSRGVGDMELRESHGKEVHYVMPNFSIVTWDAVAEPSVSTAILNLAESRIRQAKKELGTNLFSSKTYENMLLDEIRKQFR